MRITVKRKSIIFLVVILGGCSVLLHRFFAVEKIKNVVVISIDTCRADYLSCYGYPKKTTPNIDQIASQGVLFENVISPVPLTLPSHCSILTGTVPLYHNVLDNSFYRLSENNITLAEKLQDHDFNTAAFVSAYVLNSNFGLDQGFGRYDDYFEDEISATGINERLAEHTSNAVIDWLGKNKDRKNFIFAHFFDPHAAYDAPEAFTSKFRSVGDDRRSEQFAKYAGEIAYTDHHIGRIINELKKLGLYDSALICITSDHGESLLEHGEFTHGFFVYQSTLRVPLIFKIPGKTKSLRINNTVALIDIFPTICSILGIDYDRNIQGKSLTAYFEEKSEIPVYPDRYIYSQSLLPTRYDANPLLAVVTDNYKYIQTTNPELYDLKTDPHELANLIELQPERARIMKDRLQRILKESSSVNKEKMHMDAESIARLESLGYVGATVDDSLKFDRTKEDPKNLIEFHDKSIFVDSLINQKKFKAAGRLCNKLISSYPDFYMGYYKMAEFLMTVKKTDEAIEYFDRTIGLNPDYADAYVGAADACTQRKDYDKAIRYCLKALDLAPDNVDAYYQLANGYFQQDMYHAAEKYLTSSLTENFLYPGIKVKLAQTLLGKKQFALAKKYFLDAFEKDPKDQYILNGLAWICCASANDKIRDPAQGLKYAFDAVKYSGGKSPEILDTLAVAYAATGEFDQAVKTAEKAFELARFKGKLAMAEKVKNNIALFKAEKMYFDPGLQ